MDQTLQVDGKEVLANVMGLAASICMAEGGFNTRWKDFERAATHISHQPDGVVMLTRALRYARSSGERLSVVGALQSVQSAAYQRHKMLRKIGNDAR